MAKRQKIGWREWVGFPDLGVASIKAKIDTGARTSAIHAFRIRERQDLEIPHVEFYLHPVQRRKKPEIRCVVPVVDKRMITSSNGTRQMRYVIATHLKLGSKVFPIELTLADRDDMTFRVLIGREALRRKFIIDPSASYLATDIQE